jgi:hypothetical protein
MLGCKVLGFNMPHAKDVAWVEVCEVLYCLSSRW